MAKRISPVLTHGASAHTHGSDNSNSSRRDEFFGTLVLVVILLTVLCICILLLGLAILVLIATVTLCIAWPQDGIKLRPPKGSTDQAHSLRPPGATVTEVSLRPPQTHYGSTTRHRPSGK